MTQAGYIIDDYGPFCVTNGIATQKEVNICLGEAKLMRALAYWYLIMFWHDVPIVDNATTIGSSAYANRFEDVLQYAICQAEFANKWLPMRPYSKGRLSKVSAQAILSRLYLTAANYAQGNHFTTDFITGTLDGYYADDALWKSKQTLSDFYYSKAASMAQSCIDNALSNGYGLMNDYEDIFKVQNNNCKEALFSLQFVAGSKSYGLINDQQGTYCYDRCLNNNFGMGYLKASYDFIVCSIKRGGLSRTRGNIMPSYMTYNYLFHEHDTCRSQGEVWTVGNLSMLPIKKQVVGGPIATDNVAIQSNSGFNTPMVRLSEVYLNLTESLMGKSALTETTNPEILWGVNQVRRRAYAREIDLHEAHLVA